MEDKDILTIPYVVYESMQARDERQHIRLVHIIILLSILLAVTNVIWLVVFSQYDYVSSEEYEIEASQDGEGVNIIGAGGDLEWDRLPE